MDKNRNTDNPQYEFHYNREDRLSMMPESVLEFKKRKRKNKSLLILWLDIALIVILSSGFLIYQKMTGNSFKGENYTFSMKSFIYDDNLLISVTSVNRKPAEKNDKNNTSIPVEMIVKLSKNDDFYKKIFDVLPLNSSDAKTYRVSIPLTEIPVMDSRLSHIFVNIKFENSSIDIKQKIVYEK